MVTGIRTVEKALGDGIKKPTASETKNLAIARRSLATIDKVRAGECFSEANLGALRPGTGLSPMAYWDRLGQRAARDLAPGTLIPR